MRLFISMLFLFFYSNVINVNVNGALRVFINLIPEAFAKVYSKY